MIALLIYSLLFIFGLICALISTIPQTKKFLPPWLQSSHHHNIINTPQQQDPIGPTSTAAGGGRLRGVFATFDKNNDGYITKHELRESLEKIGIVAGERDVECMVEKVDSNGDGLVDYDEFCKLYGGEVEGGLREAFEVFDGNKDGLITVEELGLVLSSLGFSEGRKIEDCQEMIRKVDVDGDGTVNFDEFKKMMRDGTWKGD